MSMHLRVVSLCALALALPVSAQDRFRLADPQALSASGNGWSVEPRLGGLSLTIPVATVPGELPIPVAMEFAAQFKSQRTDFYEWIPGIKAGGSWVFDYSEATHRPILATQHFGFISNAGNYNGVAESKTYVLEGGAQARQEDLVSYSSWVARVTPAVSSFALPTSFGMVAKTNATVSVASAGGFATYAAAPSELGTWQTKVAGLAPVGYTLPSPMTYQVIMDKDRARVFLFLAQFNAWVPVLWVDRYGHSVGFQWTRSVSNLPAGVLAVHTVKAVNQRGKGLQLEWAEFSQPFPTAEQDLLRTDFIGFSSPSVFVRGYPGWSALKPVGFSQAAADVTSFVTPSIPGPMGRPTRVQVGSSASLPVPSWQGGAPIPLPPPPQGTQPILTWQLGYDANQAALTSFAEPNGTITQFARYESLQIPVPTSNNLAVRPGPLMGWAMAETASTDALGTLLRRDWVRSTSAAGEPVVTARQVFGSLAQAQRKTEYTFAGPTQTPHFGNGALKMIRVLDAAGVEWAKTTLNLATAGLGDTYSAASGQVVARKGEPTRTISVTRDTNAYSIPVTRTTTFVGAANLKIQDDDATYDSKLEALDFQRPTSTTTTRYKADGMALLPVRTVGIEYDTQGLVSKTYADGGATLGKVGQAFSYDSEGRVAVQAPYHSLFAAASEQDYAYDAATGLPSTQTTLYAGSGSPTLNLQLQRTFSNFDDFGHARTLTDERGVSTSVTYDLRGRLTSSQRQGEAVTTYSYPDELTRTVTSNGLTTTQHLDGFGRVVSIDLPDGRKQLNTYDLHGRLTVQRIRTGAGLESPSTADFDVLDRPVLRTNPAGTVQSISYDLLADQTILTTTLDQTGLNAQSKECRDGFGQVVKSVSPNGTVTTSTFDGAGNALQVVQTPASGGTSQTRTFTYDGLGRMTSRSEPETGLTLFSGFNASGQPTQIQEGALQDGSYRRSRTLVYDSLGRLIQQSAVGTSEYLKWIYTGADLTGMETKNADGTVVSQAFTYAGGPGKRLSQEATTAPGWSSTLGYTYDAATGRLQSMAYPSGRSVNYGYDSLGRLATLSQTLGGSTSALITGVTYADWSTTSDWGSMQRVTYASGAYDDWSTQKKDSQTKDWILGFKNASGVMQTVTASHAFNSAGQLSQAGDWSLVHDKEDHLIAANAPALGVQTSHGYDAFDNAIQATSQAGGDPAMPSFSLGTLVDNRIPATFPSGLSTGWSYSRMGEAASLGVLDAGGTLLRSLLPSWDGLGRLSQIQENVGGPVVHAVTYAPSGLRIRVADARTPGNNRRYAYTARGTLLGEYSDNGSWRRDVLYFGGRAVAEVDANGTHELHSDHLGTPRVITQGASGQIEGKQAYGPYGERLSNAAVSWGYAPLTGYTGHVQTDPTGLVYMRGRFYAPQWRHFLNSDQGVDPNSFNQFSYVGGSPLQGTDPTGMKKTILYYRWVCDGGMDWPSGFECTVGHWEGVEGDDGSGSGGGENPFDPGSPGSPATPQTPQKRPCGEQRALLRKQAILRAQSAYQDFQSQMQGVPMSVGGASLDLAEKIFNGGNLAKSLGVSLGAQWLMGSPSQARGLRATASTASWNILVGWYEFRKYSGQAEDAFNNFVDEMDAIKQAYDQGMANCQ